MNKQHLCQGGGLNYSIGLNVEIIGISTLVVIHNKRFLKYKDHLHGPLSRIIADCRQYYVGYGKTRRIKLTPYYYESIKVMSQLGLINLEIFPVLTISTNTDIDRNLRTDSFAVLCFDKIFSNETYQ